MKRNMETVRALLLRLESLPMKSASSIVMISAADKQLSIEGISPQEVDYHLALIVEQNLIECAGNGLLNGAIAFRRLTWEGHDFVDAVRDDEIWRKTKAGAEQAGGLTFDLVKDLAKGFIKTQIKKYTDVEI